MHVVFDTVNLDDRTNYIYDHVWFAVPMWWFMKTWEELGGDKEFGPLSQFDNEYTWDDTIDFYWKAIDDGMIIWEQKRDFMSGKCGRRKYYPYGDPYRKGERNG